MAYFIRTTLGRSVPVEDIVSVQEDLILEALRDARVSPFNASNSPVSEVALANATGLSPLIVNAICGSLVNRRWVEKFTEPETAYRITGDGVLRVESLRATSGSADW